MYYEEKLIDGVLHCRGTPDGEWTPFTLAMYERRRAQDTKRIERLEAALRESADMHAARADWIEEIVKWNDGDATLRSTVRSATIAARRHILTQAMHDERAIAADIRKALEAK